MAARLIPRMKQAGQFPIRGRLVMSAAEVWAQDQGKGLDRALVEAREQVREWAPEWVSGWARDRDRFPGGC